MPRQYLPKHNGPICFPTHGKQSRTKRQIYIDSAATSREEIGNPPHYGTVNKLRQEGIPVLKHRAIQMTKQDYKEYDYIIGMDAWNLRNMNRITGGDPDGKYICY